MIKIFLVEFAKELSRPEALDTIINILAIVLGWLIIYSLGLRAYRNQRNFDEVRNFYLKDGLEYLHQEISYYFSAFQYNYEVLNTLLKNIRDYEKIPEYSISFEDIKIEMMDYNPKGFALRSMQTVEYLIEDNILTKSTLNLFGYLSASRILFNEIYVTIKKSIEYPKIFMSNKKERIKLYENLRTQIEEKKGLIYKNIFVLEVLQTIITEFRYKYYLCTSLNKLKKKIKKDSLIKKYISLAYWNPIIEEMKKKGVSIQSFLGKFYRDKMHQKIKMKQWEKFEKLIERHYVEPCTYEEAEVPIKIKNESEKWKKFLNKRYDKDYLGSYKLVKIDDSAMEEIKEILIEGYLPHLESS